MKSLSDVKFSTLDLVLRTGQRQRWRSRCAIPWIWPSTWKSLATTVFGLAEHHNMDGIASSATSVLLGYLAGGTSTIRVGSGGAMLPNHAPLVIAEQFGTLESLYPDVSTWALAARQVPTR